MSRYLCFCILLCSFIGVPNARAQDAVPFEYSARFRLHVPEGWEAVRDLGAMRAFVGSPVTGPGDDFRENVNVVIDGLLAHMTPEEYVQLNLTQMEQSLVNFSVTATEEVELAGYPARRMEFEHQIEGRHFRVLSYTVLAEDRAYVLTATAMIQTFAEFELIFEKVIQSFVPG